MRLPNMPRSNYEGSDQLWHVLKFEVYHKNNVKSLRDFKQGNVIIIFSYVHYEEWIRGEILKKERPIRRRWQSFRKELAFAWTSIVAIGIKRSIQNAI